MCEPRGKAAGPEGAAGVDIEAGCQGEVTERSDSHAAGLHGLENQEIAAGRRGKRRETGTTQSSAFAMQTALAGQSAANSGVARTRSGAVSRATTR